MGCIENARCLRIIEQTGWDEDFAMERFMSSRVYALLEKEESKVWQYSSVMLAELFTDEREGHLTFPEV